jgi:putative redox protein
MDAFAFASAAAGNTVLVTETGVEPLQLVGRTGTSTFLAAGSRSEGALPSGLDPYEMLSASLAACTALTIRLYAQRRGLPLSRVQVNVARRRAAESGPVVFERAISLEGPLDDMQRTALMNVATSCPVARLLGRGADVRMGLSGDCESEYAAQALSNYRDDLERIASDDPRMGFD